MTYSGGGDVTNGTHTHDLCHECYKIGAEARAYLAESREREGELVEKARAYLKRGLHLMGCNGFPHTKEPCDCGFQALKDALAALGEKV